MCDLAADYTARRIREAHDQARVAQHRVAARAVQHIIERFGTGSGDQGLAGMVDAAGKDPVSEATLAYGVANWHLYNGRKDEAKALFQKIVTGPDWMPFGFIAAEAELARMK
jgi:hypothetical protein